LERETRSHPNQLSELPFCSAFAAALPCDPLDRNESRAVAQACYSPVLPTPVAAPRLLAWSDELAATLGIARPGAVDAPAVQVLAGNRLAPGMRPFAARYGGHQFGHWAGQLGDGRAISLGEIGSGVGAGWELQLKGAGRTPYSRHADGRAVLRSSLREFLCSEAMHGLGVPTTRALSLVTTGEPVLRDMFYDGNARPEPGAIVCRAAPSFVRFGNFEIHAALGEDDSLRRLADFVLERHFPEFGPPSPAAYAAMYREVSERTALMVAHWMRVGFVHGVMNTDNMSILGLTIDYGPYGWLEGYDPGWTPNTTDAAGRRYCYGNQPQIAAWNLARLGGALLSLVDDRDSLQQGLEHFGTEFERRYRGMLLQKLGLESLSGERDEAWLGELFDLMGAAETDMTIFFRRLAQVPLAPGPRVGAASGDDELRRARLAPLVEAFYDPRVLEGEHGLRLAHWLEGLAARALSQAPDPQRRAGVMNAANPLYVPRNYLAQQAIDAATEGDPAPLERLLAVLRRPYEEQPGQESLAARRPEWARHRAGCSALSCSS
jgi:uncharacterized protein YdiU (UPF0061 family)